MNRKKGSERKYFFISALTICIIIVLWWLFVDVLGYSKGGFPGPVKVVNSFAAKMVETKPDGATLLQHVGSSLRVTLIGYFCGALFGVPLGIAMAWNKTVDMFVRPLFDLIRPIPGIAWIPVFILLFGIGLTSKVAVIFIASMTACTVNAYTGIRQTKDVHLWVGDVFGASNAQKLFKIAIPTAIPMIFTGLRVAMGAAWTALVAAELLASSEGLGFMIQQARAMSRTDLVVVGMLSIGIVGAFLDAILHYIEVRVAKGMNAK